MLNPGVSVKKYPCCYMTHRALDATLAASASVPLSPADIESIVVRVPEGSTSALIHHRPQTGLEGKFSMEYCVAAAALDGAIAFRTFEDHAVLRPEAQDLLRRVEIQYAPRDDAAQRAARVSIRLRDGSERSAEVMVEHGSASDPLSWDELAAKYRDCAARVLPPSQVEASYNLVANLDSLTQIRDLMRTLSLDSS